MEDINRESINEMKIQNLNINPAAAEKYETLTSL
jgi:hypothetical protein